MIEWNNATVSGNEDPGLVELGWWKPGADAGAFALAWNEVWLLPWGPTVNTHWRHLGNKTLLSKEGRQYRKLVHQVCGIHKNHKESDMAPSRVRFHADLLLAPPESFGMRRWDIDNRVKPILDAAEGWLFDDDSRIRSLTVEALDPRESKYAAFNPDPRGAVLLRLVIFNPDDIGEAQLEDLRSRNPQLVAYEQRPHRRYRDNAATRHRNRILDLRRQTVSVEVH